MQNGNRPDLLVPQCDHRIDSRPISGGQVASQNCRSSAGSPLLRSKPTDRSVSFRIETMPPVLTPQGLLAHSAQARLPPVAPLRAGPASYPAALGAERHPDADFARSARDSVRRGPVQAETGNRQDFRYGLRTIAANKTFSAMAILSFALTALPMDSPKESCYPSFAMTNGQSGSKSEVLQGTLDLMILKTLQALGPRHGFGIARRLEQVSEDVLRLNEGTVYTSLLRLQQSGWISSEWGVQRTIAKPGITPSLALGAGNSRVRPRIGSASRQ
jgi:PadR family transcriptional regulator